MKNRLLLFIVVALVGGSCSPTSKTIMKDDEFSKILNVSLVCILKTQQLAKEYYNQPLQILANKNYPIN